VSSPPEAIHNISEYEAQFGVFGISRMGINLIYSSQTSGGLLKRIMMIVVIQNH
jgi:hypothetical protein